MSVQNVSLSAMFGWVVDSFHLVRKNIVSMMGASGLTLLLVVLLLLPMWLIMFATMKQTMGGAGMPGGVMPMAGHWTLFIALYGLTIVLGLALFPPVLSGWFRLCQGMDQGNAVAARDILKPFQDRPLWFRGVRFAILALITYVGIYALVFLAFRDVISDFMQLVAAQQAAAMAGVTMAPPGLPPGFFLAYFCFIVLGIFLQFVYLLGFAEVSLQETGAVDAMKLAGMGVLRNLLKLVLFLIAAFFVLTVAFFFIAFAVALILWILSLIHQMLAMLVAGVCYLLFLLCIYPLMFAGSYFMWKSVLGGGNATLPKADDAMLTI